ncbi:MAG TPA: dihydropteroate synthase [Opitutaceae bacterium]|nr:dihydropteroate synthase [Opitutaceae bacterium]
MTTTPPPATRVLECRGRRIVLGAEPVIVGIVNVTPDSFFDGGRYASTEAAVAHAEKLVAEGAGMLDIGGMSTRPGHEAVSEAEEIARVVPVIAALVKKVSVPLSVDTYKPAVARAALEAGAHVLNDIHGLQRAPEMAVLAAHFGAAAIAMHFDESYSFAPGEAIAMQLAFFRRTIAIAMEAGLSAEKLVLDPGIGFHKTQAQNLELIARIGELRAIGLPVLLGASRKSVIAHVLGLPPEERLEGTLATTALAAWQRVEFLRVHDVAANLRAARMAAALRNTLP